MSTARFASRVLTAMAAGLLAGSALAVPSLAAAAAAAAAPAPVGRDDGTLADGAAAYRTAYPQMSESAARSAFSQQMARKQVSEEAAGDPATFGGSWFDPPAGVLHVAVTSARVRPGVQQVADNLGVRLQVDLVPRSYTALQRQADAVRTGSGALSRAAAGRVGIDVAANQVTVAVPEGSLAAPAGVRLVGAPAAGTELDACTSRLWCDSTLRAGPVLWHYGLPICSAGFTARAATGQRYVYTAGHCDIIPGPWGTAARTIGPLTSSQQDGAVDAGIIRVDNPAYANGSGGEVYDQNAAHSVPVNDVARSMTSIQPGDVACLAANFADVTGPNLCGVVGSAADPAHSGMVTVDGVDACTGDSGGGWYWLASTTYRVAYGVHSDSDDGCHGDSGGSHSWFSPMPLITAAFGLTVETS